MFIRLQQQDHSGVNRAAALAVLINNSVFTFRIDPFKEVRMR